MRAIRIYAWSTVALLALVSVSIRRIAIDLAEYMDALKHPGIAYPPLSEFAFIVTPWLGVLPIALCCLLIVARFRRLDDRVTVHAWGGTCLLFFVGLLLAVLGYVIPWISKVSEMQP